MAEIERFCVQCRTQVDPASAQANAGGRTRLSGAGQRPRSTVRLCHRPLPHRRTAQSATRLSSVEIKACAPGAQLDGGPIAGAHRTETDSKNGSQIGQLN